MLRTEGSGHRDQREPAYLVRKYVRFRNLDVKVGFEVRIIRKLLPLPGQHTCSLLSELVEITTLSSRNKDQC